MSVFIKYHDFTIAQKQCQMARPSATTAIILNEARRMVAEIWDGVTPLRQVGLGVSKLTHEPYEQLTLFEDPQIEYYREWDRLYDEEKSQAEDARMLAFGRKVVQPAEIPPPRPSRRRSELKDNSLVFTYSDGEQALAAAKSAVKQNPTFRLYSKRQEDGTRYFVVVDEDGKAVERHFIVAVERDVFPGIWIKTIIGHLPENLYKSARH